MNHVKNNVNNTANNTGNNKVENGFGSSAQIRNLIQQVKKLEQQSDCNQNMSDVLSKVQEFLVQQNAL